MNELVDPDRYPNLHAVLNAKSHLCHEDDLPAELQALITEREQAAKREARAILVELLRKVDGALVDVDALCGELGIDREVNGG